VTNLRQSVQEFQCVRFLISFFPEEMDVAAALSYYDNEKHDKIIFKKLCLKR